MKPLFSLMLEGYYRRDQLLIDYNADRYSTEYLGAALRSIDTQWREKIRVAKNTHRSLFNAPLFRLDHISYPNGSRQQVQLHLGNTDYREYVCGRDHGGFDRQANPVGTAIVAVTADGYIPFGIRSTHVDANPGRYFTFGGFFDRKEDFYQHQPCLFHCAARELKEETSIDISMDDLRLLCVVYDHVHPHPEACFVAYLPCDCNEFRKVCPESEIATLRFVSIDQLETFISSNQINICESLLGGLDVFCRLPRELRYKKMGMMA